MIAQKTKNQHRQGLDLISEVLPVTCKGKYVMDMLSAMEAFMKQTK